MDINIYFVSYYFYYLFYYIFKMLLRRSDPAAQCETVNATVVGSIPVWRKNKLKKYELSSAIQQVMDRVVGGANHLLSDDLYARLTCLFHKKICWNWTDYEERRVLTLGSLRLLCYVYGAWPFYFQDITNKAMEVNVALEWEPNLQPSCLHSFAMPLRHNGLQQNPFVFIQ